MFFSIFTGLCNYCYKWNFKKFLYSPQKQKPVTHEDSLFPLLHPPSPQFSSVQSLSRVWLFSVPGLQHPRLPCPSPTPGACSNSCPSVRWCHRTISSSVFPFSSCLQSCPASESFPISQFFASGGPSIGVSASASVLPMNIQDGFPCGWTGWISLQSKELSRVFSDTLQKHQFSVLSFLHSLTLISIHDHWKNHSFDKADLCWQSNASAF